MLDPSLSLLENLEVNQMYLLIIFSAFAIVAPITMSIFESYPNLVKILLAYVPRYRAHKQAVFLVNMY